MRRRGRLVRYGLLVCLMQAAAFPTYVSAQPEEEITDDDLDDELPDEEETDDYLKLDAEDDTPDPPPPPVNEIPIVDDDDDAPLFVDESAPVDPPPPATDDEPADFGDPPPPPSLPDLGDVTPPPPPPPPPPVRARPLELPTLSQAEAITERQLLDQIESRANYVRLQDEANAAVELAYIEETRRTLGARNVVVASQALIREASAALDVGATPTAIKKAEAAARISPDLSAAHWMRARAYWANDKAQVASIAHALGSVVKVKLMRFRNVVSLLSNIAVLFGLALLGTIALFALIQLLKYVRYPAHDFASIWPSFIGAGEVVMLILILLALPLAFGFGLLPTIALTLAVVMAYQSKRERTVSIAMLVVMGLSPAFLYLASPLVTYHGSVTDAMASAVTDAFSAEAEERLREHLKTNRNDYAASVILAYRMRQRGDFAQAELEYQRALRSDPQSALARNNLGVVQYLQGRTEQAQSTFRSAMNQQDLAEPYLNLASIVVDNAQFDQANQFLESARSIDPDLTLLYTQGDTGLPTKQKMLEAQIGQSLLWARLFESDSAESLAISRALWAPIGGHVPPLGMPIVALIAGILGFLMIRLSDRLSTPCPRCGIAADRGSPAHFCAQCVSVFLTAVAVDPQVRAAKEHQVRRHQRGRRHLERIMSLAAGVGQMYGSRPVVGSLLTFLFLVALGAAAFPDGFVVNRWDIFVDTSAHVVASGVALAAAAVLALVSLRQAFK